MEGRYETRKNSASCPALVTPLVHAYIIDGSICQGSVLFDMSLAMLTQITRLMLQKFDIDIAQLLIGHEAAVQGRLRLTQISMVLVLAYRATIILRT
ncbi:hypothetical protein OBBRIDRAFT_48997 [Obba rivulosa]|uniref:Uncharacterized protein n=1 Tax=Obba rivulosa TaxID=1052685 RepID=A0A8E2J561_9APHY|nr:hypothetical protein OBBRIDRAFT_48997 [Obba rivulosa]